MQKKFDYTAWALMTAAQCLDSDMGCGFEVADNTPDPEKAREAMQRLIDRLNREADRRSSQQSK